MALDHTIQAGIEHDLYRYRRWTARYAQVLEELRAALDATGYHMAQVSQRQRRASDPTWRAVQRREDLEREAQELERKIKRVNRALEAMDPEQRRLVELYYFERAPRWEVMDQLGISRRQFYRLRAGALETYAYVAGLVSDSQATA
ncbi:MAG: DUF1492 domain-containing protein [Pseudomonadota bacterium]